MRSRYDSPKLSVSESAGEVAAAVGVVTVGLVAVVYGIKLGLTASGAIGSGMLPLLVGCGLVLCGAGLGLHSARKRPGLSARTEATPATRRRATPMTILLLAALAFALPWLGYPVASFLFMLGATCRRGKVVSAVVFALLVSGGTYALFVQAFAVPLPSGVIFGGAR